MFKGVKRRACASRLIHMVMFTFFIGSLYAQNPDGGELFSSTCAGCHGSDGRGGEHAPNIAAAPEVQRLPDLDLVRLVAKGVPGAGMPGFAWMGQDKVSAIVTYLRTLQGRGTGVVVVGNPVSGESLFRGKAKCAECHMVNGSGGFIASDLSVYGADASPSEIRTVIMDPARNLPTQSRPVTLTTKDGHVYSGLPRLEDNFSITLQSADGAFHYLQKSGVATVERGSRSLMPADYGTTLSSAEVDDLVSYLIHAGTEEARRSARRGPKSNDDEE